MGQHSAAAEHGDAHDNALDELGTLVLRVWREPDSSPHGLRVRVLTSEGPREPASSAVVADVDSAVAAVRSWLEKQQGD
ncbi:hypothetical protein GCM10012320_16950 [Sinomonas cellulolyticus]|uniref:Uncharacterized protein n=1 Tax=Sinomonas cellulolyticus TaxID=2801916 RepID=A0ABS1JYQ7_9MICC|nr:MULTISPECIES: hypothetical protein [Sinomonas]MBL0704519.1 hypothetical protein [Sinomonas cellulolyticus]GHG49148.1 hypothetical protein GCM10012320_16950 [Sinomonas sp. KCTC 49339]